MKKNRLLNLIFFFTTCFCFHSCKKTAGEGGTSSIRGKITVQDWNSGFTVKNGEYPGADREVYIVYGDNVAVGDRIRADYNGEFEFKYLRKGKYKVYVYSEDNTLQSVSGQISILREAEIKKNRETVTLEEFTVYE